MDNKNTVESDRQPIFDNVTASRTMQSYFVAGVELDGLSTSRNDATIGFSFGSVPMGVALNAYVGGAGSADMGAYVLWLVVGALFYAWGIRGVLKGRRLLNTIKEGKADP